MSFTHRTLGTWGVIGASFCWAACGSSHQTEPGTGGAAGLGPVAAGTGGVMLAGNGGTAAAAGESHCAGGFTAIREVAGSAAMVARCGGTDVFAGAFCNGVDPGTVCITPTRSSEPLPQGAGGEIVPGTYDLTAATYYWNDVTASNNPTPTTPNQSTLVISPACGGEWAVSAVEVSGVGVGAYRWTSYLRIDNGMLTGHNQCPIDEVWVAGFTATATTLDIFAEGQPGEGEGEHFVRRE